jgi:catechol 2,3-dioxygenase-like lactoylglutathione lyase family enzyme
MAKLRHLALQVPDLEKAARFYEDVFQFERVQQAETPVGDAVMLSDGVMNLTLLHFPNGEGGQINGPDWAGLHHMGFIVDDKEATAERIEANGGKFFMELPGGYPGVDAETKYRDNHGIVFDISEHDWTQSKTGG